MKSSNSLNIDGPLHLDHKETLLFPDDFDGLIKNGIAKDSYGNPVTPFPLNDEELKLRAGFENNNNNGFVIPSYASGILDIHDPNLPRVKKPELDLLPPLSSGNFYYPGVKVDISTETIPSNTFNKPTGSIQIPSDSLLPPLEYEESIFDQPIPDQRPFQIPTSDLLPPITQTLSQPKQPNQAPVNKPTNVQFKPITEIVNETPETFPTAPLFQSQSIQTPQQSIVTPVVISQNRNSDGEKYTGGFGGPVGGLGNGRPGFAIGSNGRLDPSKLNLAAPPPATVALPPRVSENEKYNGGFGFGSSNTPSQVGPPKKPIAVSSSTSDKYSGGFGFTNSNAQFQPIPVAPPKKPTVVSSFTSDKYTGGFGFTNPSAQLQAAPASAPVAPIQKPTVITSSTTGDKYTGGFGFGNSKPGGVQAVHLPSKPVSSGEKYTGGFGGPPGFLNPFDNIHRKTFFLINIYFALNKFSS